VSLCLPGLLRRALLGEVNPMSGKPTSFRFTEEDRSLFETLEKSTGLTRLDVIRLALRLLSRTWELAPALGVQALPDELAKRHSTGTDTPARRGRPNTSNKSE
jgi:hypothetical protein